MALLTCREFCYINPITDHRLLSWMESSLSPYFKDEMEAPSSRPVTWWRSNSQKQSRNLKVRAPQDGDRTQGSVIWVLLVHEDLVEKHTQKRQPVGNVEATSIKVFPSLFFLHQFLFFFKVPLLVSKCYQLPLKFFRLSYAFLTTTYQDKMCHSVVMKSKLSIVYKIALEKHDAVRSHLLESKCLSAIMGDNVRLESLKDEAFECS